MKTYPILWIYYFLISAFVPAMLSGQEQDKPIEPQEEITVQRILDEMATARKKAENNFTVLLVEISEDTISQLKELARDHAAEGNIASARDAWTELLKLDPSNSEGKDFCEALGIWEQVRKQIARFNKRSDRTISKIQFQCESGRTFRKLSNGVWSDSDNPAKYREIDRNEYSVTIVPMTRSAEVHLLLPDHFLWAKQKDWNNGQRYRGENGGWVR